MSDLSHRFEPLLDSEEAAAIVKVHPKTLQRYARNGLVVGLRLGKLWRFRASDLIPLAVEISDLDEDIRSRYSVLNHSCSQPEEE
jgi:predicted site-specific integrase-resolvase